MNTKQKEVTSNQLNQFKQALLEMEYGKNTFLFAQQRAIKEQIKELEVELEPRIKFMLKWYDIWIGLFIDRSNRYVYICPLPMVVFRIKY